MARRHPQRRSLPLHAWPAPDRAAWAAAIAEGDIFEGRGPAAHWRPATRATNLDHYARWLGFLDSRGALAAPRRPEDRVTPEAVADYVARLRGEVAPRTVVPTGTWTSRSSPAARIASR